MPSSKISETTSLGLFNYANSYRVAAAFLSATADNIHPQELSSHPEAPIRFLYIHAIELYLKSYVRSHKNENQVKEFGHNLKKLLKECKALELPQQCREDIIFLNSERKNLSYRYIETGFKRELTRDAMHSICIELHNKVGLRLEHITTEIPPLEIQEISEDDIVQAFKELDAGKVR